MHCPDCGKELVRLDDIARCSGRNWHGCEVCNKVFEHRFCSVSGASRGITEDTFLNLEEYRERLKQNEKRHKHLKERNSS